MKTNTTALLVMDLQMGLLPRMPQQGGQIIQNASQAIKVARQKAIPVIFIRLGFQKGLPEVSPDNKMFSTLKRNLSDAGLSEFMRIPTELGQQEQDLVIDKKRVSAFSGNSLDMILRAQGITHLVLSGISTGVLFHLRFGLHSTRIIRSVSCLMAAQTRTNSCTSF